MIKQEELANPQSCLNKALDDEMLFVLLARDTAAPDTIRHWCKLRIRSGKNKDTDAQIMMARATANDMEHQRKVRTGS